MQSPEPVGPIDYDPTTRSATFTFKFTDSYPIGVAMNSSFGDVICAIAIGILWTRRSSIHSCFGNQEGWLWSVLLGAAKLCHRRIGWKDVILPQTREELWEMLISVTRE